MVSHPYGQGFLSLVLRPSPAWFHTHVTWCIVGLGLAAGTTSRTFDKVAGLDSKRCLRILDRFLTSSLMLMLVRTLDHSRSVLVSGLSLFLGFLGFLCLPPSTLVSPMATTRPCLTVQLPPLGLTLVDVRMSMILAILCVPDRRLLPGCSRLLNSLLEPPRRSTLLCSSSFASFSFLHLGLRLRCSLKRS